MATYVSGAAADGTRRRMWPNWTIFLVAVGLTSLVAAAVAEIVPRPRGVSLTNEPFYRDSGLFTCLDGSRQISKAQVNDDYCDCMDGTDEPGTSACPHGKFHCNNRGFKPKYIPSSRVNDGICDCCDASDEYRGEGATKCQNNCRELGRADMERRQKEIILMNQGFGIRQDYIKQGLEKKAEREDSLKKLREEKEVADQVKVEKDTLKQEAEAPEKQAKDAHKAAWEAQQALLKAEQEKQRAEQAFRELDADANGLVTPSELLNHKEFDTDNDGVVSEDEAKVALGDVDQVAQPDFVGPLWSALKDKFKFEEEQEVPEEQVPVSPPPPIDAADAGEEEDFGDEDDIPPEEDLDDIDDDEDYDEDMDEAEVMEEYRQRREEAKRRQEEGKDKDEQEEGGMPEYDEATKKLIEVADAARSEFNEAERKVNDLKRSIEDLERLLSVDLGLQQEFAPLQKQCYEYTDREYTYKLCPFDKTSQRPKTGGSETQLGTWGQWSGPPENKYSKMSYTKGRNCWNGPDRSTTVILRCSTENKLVAATEPERCTYEFVFETPALCTTKTDLETGETDMHDEL